ncbi:MAG: alpha-L-rhamnosidase C-terminal domain-containing protein [Verrucomicrobiota bacterium]
MVAGLMEAPFHDLSSTPGDMVWPAGTDAVARNAFVLFTREFSLEGNAGPAVLTLFADSRYELRVNGEWVASGPGRFLPAFPRYDVWHIAEWLRPGANRIEVIVNAPGTSSFQTDPASRGGFAAGGQVSLPGGRIELGTPGGWRARTLRAWSAEAPVFSFAQGPVEICDRRVLKREFAEAAGEKALSVSGPWGRMLPREVPPPAFTLAPPVSVAGPVRWSGEEEVSAFCIRRAPGRLVAPPIYVFKTWIHSTRARDWDFASLWLHPRVNGRLVEGHGDALRGNRTNYTARIEAGWNLLTGHMQGLAEYWTVQLGFAREGDVAVSAHRDAGDAFVLNVAGPLDPGLAERFTGDEAGDAALWEDPALDWKPVLRGWREGAPARRVAWVTPESSLQEPSPPPAGPLRLAVGRAGGSLVVLEWGTEFLGHLRIEVEAPAGAILDAGWGETLRADGCVMLYAGNPMIEPGDRFILAGGRETIDGFAVRGGRFLQLVADLSHGGEGEVIIHSVTIRSTQTPLADTGRFTCDDPLWNWVWDAGRRTLEACMEDTYLDCPWRERGLYLGDAWVEARMQRGFDANPAITRRCLRLFAEGQMPDGQMQAVVPSWHGKPHADFTLCWILFLHDHWAWTGDRVLVEELWPAVGRILESGAWRADGTGLWDATDLHLFIDWGVLPEWRRGRGNACINALRAEALRRAGELAREIGREDEARRLEAEADGVRAAFRRHLFDDKNGRFRASLDEPESPPQGAIHANILALLFGLATPEQRGPATAFVLHALEEAASHPQARPGRVELFFLHYALDLLYGLGEVALADRVVRSYYGTMQAAGAPTFWETLAMGRKGAGSLCHAWSGAATQACITRVIGLRPAVPGRTDRYLIAPCPGPLRHAECVFPHPRGAIQVRWTRDEHGLHVRASGPVGVELIVAHEEARSVATG